MRPALKKKKDGDYTVEMRLEKGDQPTALRFIVARTKRHKKQRRHQKSQRLALLTNLTAAYWTTGRLIAMYGRRWDIETTFRENKRLFGTTKSRAKTPNTILNELHALHIYRIIMALMHAIADTESAMPRWEDLHARRYVTTQLSAIAWICLEIITTNKKIDHDKIQRLIQELKSDAPKKRPNRSHKRECKGREGVWKNNVRCTKFTPLPTPPVTRRREIKSSDNRTISRLSVTAQPSRNQRFIIVFAGLFAVAAEAVPPQPRDTKARK